MADVKIGAELNVSTGNSSKNVDNVKDSIVGVNKEIGKTNIGAKEFTESASKVAKSNKDLKDSATVSSGAFDALKERVTATVPGLGAVQGASGLVNGAFKLLAANPLVAILIGLVVVLKALYDAFASTFEGGQKLEQVFAGIQAAAQVVVDRLVVFAGAVTKFFSGDFKGALADAKASVAGIGDEIQKTYTKVAAITKELQEIKQRDLEGDVDDAKRAARLANLKEELQSEEVSFARKKQIAKELLAEAKNEQTEGIKDDRRRTELQIELLKTQKDGARKNAEEISKLQVELFNEETAKANEVRNINKQLKAVEKQEAAAAKEAAAKAREEEKAERQRLVEFINALAKSRQENELLSMKEGLEKELKLTENKYKEELRQLELSVKDKKLKQSEANELKAEIDKKYLLEVAAANAKSEADTAAKTKEYETKLADIKKTIRLSSIEDLREKEKEAIREDFQLKINEVEANEKYTAQQKVSLQIQLRKQVELQLAVLEKKYKLEDDLKNNKQQRDTLKVQTDFEIAKGGNKLQLQREFFEASRALEREELVLKKATLQELTDFDTATATARINISNAERDAKIADANTVAGTLSSLGALAGEQTVLGKGLAIASALINTYTGATKALAQGGIFGYVAAAGIIASGLRTVQKINEVQVPGATGGGSNAGATSPIAPPPPQQQTTKLDQNSINQMGNATTRAFVVESDMTGKQERIRQLNKQSRI